MNTSDAVRLVIENSGLTQKDFAKRISVNPVTLSRNLKEDTFSKKTLEKIADAFNLSLTSLMESKSNSIPQVTGYLEFSNDIQKIRNIADLKRYVQMIERMHDLMKIKQIKLCKQSPIHLSDIDLSKQESYDATKQYIVSFKHGDDIVDGIEFTLGNMCSSFPFSIQGVHFNNSESAYIAGLYSNNTNVHIDIQSSLTRNTNGYQAKKEYRSKRYDGICRSDWEEFNIEWMKYVVWQKCISNGDFANLLKNIPEEAMIVENSTGNNNPKATIWGCHNRDLEDLREAKTVLYKNNHPNATKEQINVERNTWNNYGIWKGRNLMGKILKMCSLCLKKKLDLPIQYDILKQHNIYLLGQCLF